MVVASDEDCRKMVMYDAYTKWCNENTIEAKAENMFSKRFGKMHEAGRESAPGPDSKRQKVWESCGIRHASVTGDFDNRDDKKTTSRYLYNGENNNTSLENTICLSKSEKKHCQEKNSHNIITYRENRDGLDKTEGKIDMQSSNFTENSNRDGNRDNRSDNDKHDKNSNAVGENMEDSKENINIRKIANNVERFSLEFGIINKSNLVDATHMIAHWSKIKPSEVQPIVEKLCKIA